MIDGNQYLDIRKTTNGFYTIHQNNAQTSMFFGFDSGKNNVSDPAIFGSGTNNTAYGFATLSSNTTGSRNTAFGTLALTENTTGTTNIGIGFSALSGNETAYGNIGIGKSALRKNQAGILNVAIGTDAFNNTNFASQSIAIGGTAGANDTSSVNNVYIGFGAGRGTIFATDGYDRSDNVMIGSLSGYMCETSGNVFIGKEAGKEAKADNQLYITNSNTDSLSSLIYGQFDNSLLRINGELNIDGLYTFPSSAPTTGEFLTFDGGSTLTWDTPEGIWQTGSSGDILYDDGDVGIGISNAIYRLDVEDNVLNGYIARFRNTNNLSGSKGIIIQTGPITNPTTSTYYALFLDGNGTNIGGIRGNGSGGTMYSTTSDRRLKQNIRPLSGALELLSQINPKTYQMKSNPDQDEIGFIAQELQKILPIAVGGSPTDDVEESPMTVDYGRLSPVLVGAIQEQQTVIEQQEDKIQMLISRLDKLAAEIAESRNISTATTRGEE